MENYQKYQNFKENEIQNTHFKGYYAIIFGICILLLTLVFGIYYGITLNSPQEIMGSKEMNIRTVNPTSLQAGSFNPEDNRNIGYEFLDNGNVVHIWNDIDDYFFDVDSGIQLTNHYQDYWTRNVFCLGYYDNGEWNKINCADELTNFNKNIETDNSTYVNATLWKDITYGSYDIRLAVRYTLEIGDEDIGINIYGKNIDTENIPYDLGFAWKITDWEIYGDEVGGDSITVNDTNYGLDNTFDLTFTNMSFYWDDPVTSENGYEYLNYIRGFDYTEFLRLDWNKNLDYKVRIVGNGNQEDFYAMIMVNASRFNAGQEKSTEFRWIDAEGSYTGTYIDTAGQIANPHGCTVWTNATGEFLYVNNVATNDMHIYLLDGTYIGMVDWSQGNDNYDLANDGNYIYANEVDTTDVFKYYPNFTYTGQTWDYGTQAGDGSGIGTNGTWIWISDPADKTVYKYDMSGNYQSISWGDGEASYTGSVEAYKGNVWVSSYTDGNGSVERYDSNGVHQFHFTTTGESARATGICLGNTTQYMYVVAQYSDKIYIYESGILPPTNPNVTINSPLNQNYSNPDILLNITALDEGTITSCKGSIDSGVTNYTLEKDGSTNYYNYTIPSVSDGTYTVNFYCDSSNEKYNYTESVVFGVDSTIPDIEIVYPTNNTMYPDQYLSINYTYYDLTPDSCWYSNDSWTENTTITCGTNITNVGWTNENHVVIIWINDSVNNLNETQITFDIDATVPDIEIVYPLNETNHTNNLLSVNYTYGGTNLNSCWYSNDSYTENTTISCGINITDITWIEGFHNVTIWINNTVNNVNSSSIEFNVDTTVPDIEIVYPSNNSNYTNNLLSVNYTYYDSTPDTCWYSNDTYLENTTLTSCETNITDVTWSEGLHDVIIWINDSVNNINQTEVSFFIDSINPDIEIVFPINETNYTYNSISINYTYYDLNVDSCWYSNDTYAENTTITCGNNITDLIWEDGFHNATIWINDTFNNLNESTILFSIDILPPSIIVTAPNETINYVNENENISINFTVADTISNFDTCLFEYNGVNTTLDCSGTNYMDINETVIYTAKNNNITVFVNDTFGNENTTFYEWVTQLVFMNITYNEVALEGSSENFRLNVTLGSGIRISTADLIYNGTSYSGGVTDWGSDFYEVSKDLVIPKINATDNVTFYWSFLLDSGTTINTNEYNQSVLGINIDSCNSYNTLLLNLSLLDEETQILINGTVANSTISVNFEVYSNDSSYLVLNYSGNFTSNENPQICIDQNFTSETSYKLDAQIQYDADGYVPEFYYIQKMEIKNETLPKNINLYDLSDTDSQEFKITYKDSNFNTVPEALIQIQRQYIEENSFKTVEIPKISSTGYAVAHLVKSEQVYNFIITRNGEILDIFNNVVAYCQNPALSECEININSFASSVSPAVYGDEDLDDFGATLEYNKNTRVITSSFVIPSGASSTVLLNATLFDALGETNVCSDTLTSAGGTLSCTVPLSLGNTTIQVKLYSDGELKRSMIVSIPSLPTDIYGGNLIFLGIIIFVFIIGMGITDSPMTLGIMMFIGTVLLVVLNIFIFRSWIGAGATILWLFVATIIILIKGGNRQ